MAKKKMDRARKPHKTIEDGLKPSAGFAENLAGLRDHPGREQILKLWSGADGKLCPQLAAAFKYFDLDPKNPSDHARLLLMLTIAAFESPPRKGAPPKSNWEIFDEDFQLGLDHLMVGGLEMSDRQAAQAIKDKMPGYKMSTAGTIRQELPTAQAAVDWIRQYVELKKTKPPG